jgi:hypothetical protein
MGGRAPASPPRVTCRSEFVRPHWSGLKPPSVLASKRFSGMTFRIPNSAFRIWTSVLAMCHSAFRIGMIPH